MTWLVWVVVVGYALFASAVLIYCYYLITKDD